MASGRKRAAGRIADRISVTARAPSSTANLGPGYDAFGLALGAFFDEVEVEAVPGGGDGQVTMAEPGMGAPAAAEKNTAGLVVKRMAAAFGSGGDALRVRVKKGVPAGYGLGSSAASAAAAAAAFNRLYRLRLEPAELVRFAGDGEAASAGVPHYDNAAAAVLGGFAIVRAGRQIEAVSMDAPKGLSLCVAIPDIAVPKSKTAAARSVVPQRVPLAKCTANLSAAAMLVAAMARGDGDGVGRAATRDEIVEPARGRMMPWYRRVKEAALDAGAAGVAVSGAGPSVVAFATSPAARDAAGRAMREEFATVGVSSRTVKCYPCGGARIVGAGQGRGR